MKTITSHNPSLILAFLFLAACGGGGGGGGSSGGGNSSEFSGGSDPSSSSWTSSITTSQADVYRTTEYSAQSGLETINAAKAYALLDVNSKTVAGDGVTIAIVDSGVQTNHLEISGNYTSSGGYDYVNSDLDPSDDYGHGTAVASIAAGVKDGSGMHGVAYDSTIVSIKILDSSGSGTYSNLISGINKAVDDDVKVINMSLGGDSSSSSLLSALESAKSADILSVAATGNSSVSQPDYPAYYASDSNVAGYVLAVASVGTASSSTAISTFSNYCGDAATYCLAAPGYNIYDAKHSSSGVTNNYDNNSGTSMATPMVAGAAAVLRAAWPFLTAKQTANILLSTADDSFSGYSSAIYGQGILDLYAAVRAQGEDNFAYGSSVSSGGYSVRSSSLVSDAIFGDAFALNVAPQINKAVFFDSYGRDYKAFMDRKISLRSNNNLLAASNVAFNNYSTQTIPLSFGKNSASQLKFQLRSYADKSAQNKYGLKFITLDKSLEDKALNSSNGFSFSQDFDNNFDGNLRAGFAINRDEISNSTQDKFGNFGFMSVNNFAANPFQSFVVNNFASNRSGQFNQRNFSQFFAGGKFFDKKMALNFSQQISYNATSVAGKIGNLQNRISDVSLSYSPIKATSMMFSFGRMNEFNNNILNSKAVGAFEAAGNANTSYFKISAAQKITDNLSLVANHSEGKTAIQGNDYGIFRSYSDVLSRSSSLGLINENFFGGTVGLVYLEPMRVYSGSALIDVPVARDFDGNVTRYSTSVSLKPQGKECDFEVFYLTNLALRNFLNPVLKFNLIMQRQPNNVKSAENAYLGVISFGGRF